MMTGSLTLAWLLVASPMAQAAPPAPQSTAPVATSAIRGTVVHAQTATPIADAQVTVVETGRSVRTGADGRFTIDQVVPGAYTLSVSTIGYIFVKRRIDVTPAPLDLTIPLAEGTGTYQESVNVTADVTAVRDRGTSTVELGSAALQELRGVAADDPIRAMQALPGVATGDDFQAEFSVRGSAFRHVGIVIDGTPTSLLFHAVRGTEDTGSISMINTDVLSHASLSAGPHPRRHGDWLGATLDFDVREGSRDRAGLRLAVSGTGASFVVDGPLGRGKRGSWLVSMRKSYVDWLIRKIDPLVDSTIGFADMHAKATFDLTSRQQLQFIVVGGTATYRKPNASGANEIQRALSRSVMGSFVWRYTPSKLLITQRVSFIANDFRDTGSLQQEQGVGDTQSVVWRGDVTWPVATNWTVEMGAKADRQDSNQTLRDLTFVTGQGFRVRNSQTLNIGTTIAGGYAQLAYRSEARSLSIGTRSTADSLSGDRIDAPWIVGEQRVGRFLFTAAVGGAGQFITLDQAGRAPNPMHAERAFGTDASVGNQLTKTIRWRLTGFRRTEDHIVRRVLEDQLVNGKRVVGSPFPFYASDLDGTSRGADFVVERRATSGLTGWIGYTWAHTRYHDTRTGEDFDGDFDQRHTLNIFAQQRLSYRMNASVKLRVGSNFPVIGYFGGSAPDAMTLGTLRNQVRLPTYVRLDLRGSRTFTYERRRMTLFVEVMNATGRRNYGQADGSIRTSFDAVGYVERLIPLVPSAGILIEF